MGVEHFCSPESKGNVISQHSAKDPNVNQYLSWVRHKQQEFKPSCTAGLDQGHCWTREGRSLSNNNFKPRVWPRAKHSLNLVMKEATPYEGEDV